MYIDTPLSGIFLILWKIQRDIVTNLHSYSRKVSVILADLNVTSVLSKGFRKILKY